MGKVKQWLIEQQENGMEQDDIDAMWHQKQLDEREQQELIEQAMNRDLFERQAMLDAIVYGHKVIKERKR